MGEPDKDIGSLPEHSSSIPRYHECDHQGPSDTMRHALHDGSLLHPAHGHYQSNDDRATTPVTMPCRHDVVLSSTTSSASESSAPNEMPHEPDSFSHPDLPPTASQPLDPESDEIVVEEVVDEIVLDAGTGGSTRTFVIPQDPTTQPLVQDENVPPQSYAEQLAAALRMKTSELSWLFIEAEGRLALAREWTHEAREAGETNWARYMRDIDLLESALQDARSMLDTACDYS